MKKIHYLMYLFLAGMLFFSACEQDFLPTLPDTDLKKSATIEFNTGEAIVVEPEGADYDTDNLMAAFAKAEEYSPGAVILLTEGEYYLDYIEVHDFDGWLKGSGKNKTIIHPHPDGISVPAFASYHLRFIGGNIKISDMYFEFAEEDVTQPWAGDWTFVHDVIKFDYDPGTDNPVNALIKNVKFSGIHAPNVYTDYNVNNAIGISGSLYNFFGPIPGNLTVENCEFYTLDTPVLTVGLKEGQFKFGGSPSKANYSADNNYGLMLIDSRDLEVLISHNSFSKIQNGRGIDIEQGEYPPEYFGIYPGKSYFQVQSNKVSVEGLAMGMYIQDGLSDTDPELCSSAKINKNIINMPPGGIYAFYNYAMNNVIMNGNKLLGQPAIGFYVTGVASSNNLVNNDFSELLNNYVNIWLRPDSHDNKIICDHNTTIWDEGANNLVRGPHIMGNSLDAPGHLLTIKPSKKNEKLLNK